ncbi:porin [Caballeronia sordidicola]|uniref:Outer membrane protein (Porin) n=1 Tax=Caballeronia sordidicola TaxID=196367 RepID=A0A226WZ41_CABSO|nr:porin [Caballeronia sordidicola]OXC76444.1 Outer membrane protein (porin) [Caballeronia sordidicola]
MKKSLLALAALGTFAGAAHAQSSVTLYGIVDAGLAYANNIGGHKLYETSAGNLQGDRWGLRGTEDLGGGLKALFVLENGFNAFSGKLGQGGDEFGRQAYVGLSSQFGTVTLGRQYDSVVDYTGALEVGSQWATFYAAHPGDLDNMNNTNRVNNSIKYASANYSGITFGGLYSLGGVAGQFNRNQIFSAGLGYAQGPLVLGAGYFNVKNPNYSFFGNNSSSSATASNMTGSQVYSGFASAKTQQVLSAGGAYTFGPATVGATYSNTQFKDLGQTAVAGARAVSGNAKFHNAELNFKYQLTPALLLGAAYDYTKAYSIANEKIHQGVLGADYFLSKRTDLYVDGIYQHASGTNSLNATATAQINGLSASSTANQVAAIVGIRHKF